MLRIYNKIKKYIYIIENKSIKKRIGLCGDNVRIHNSIEIIMPEFLKIGNNTSIAAFTTIFSTYGVTIGENCWISSNCGISSYNHVLNSTNRQKDSFLDKDYSKPVSIGNNVWLGMNVVVLPGVTIGDNSVIGAGSVVTKNIPANELWFGNPAKFVKVIN